MTQRHSYDNIRQSRYWNGRQCCWCGPETKEKYEPSQYYCHNPGICKGSYSFHITNKEKNIVTIESAINKINGGAYESELNKEV